MASLNMTIKHGQSWDDARANFVKRISEAEAEHARFIKRVEWSDDRTAARLSGPGFTVDLRLDPEAVHATGEIPFFIKIMEGPIRRSIEKSLQTP